MEDGSLAKRQVAFLAKSSLKTEPQVEEALHHDKSHQTLSAIRLDTVQGGCTPIQWRYAKFLLCYNYIKGSLTLPFHHGDKTTKNVLMLNGFVKT